MLHFPDGKLPPDDAFWSLTPTDAAGYMVKKSSHRQIIGDRSSLERNTDGSVDIYLQHKAPGAHEQTRRPLHPGGQSDISRVASWRRNH